MGVMAVIRWYPFRDVVAVQNRMNSLLREHGRQQGEGSGFAAAFVPPVDVYEDEHRIVLTLEAAGLRESDLDVRLEKEVLTVRGERKLHKEEKEENFHRMERRYGSFFRSFSIPSSVDAESVQAGYDAGVLRIELAKRPEAKAKQIKVKVTAGNAQNPAAERAA
jgi:HSP20 family protein